MNSNDTLEKVLNFETNDLIESNQNIVATANVDYDSRTGILLEANCKVVSGTVFHAFIDGCGANLNMDYSL